MSKENQTNFQENPGKKRFELQVNEYTAILEYIKTADKIFLTHTEVPSELEGQGVGSKLVKNVLEEIKGGKLTLIPLCPFVANYIKKHPEWKDLVFRGVKIN
jgi:predicted GNAT family acetyltransferase